MTTAKVLKNISTLSLGALLFAATAMPSLAVTKNTTISGFVYDYNGNPVNGANLTIICNNFVKTATSVVNGSYSVVYPSNLCGIGKKVVITSNKNGQQGYSTGVVQSQNARFNVATVNVQVPEFGKIAGMVAAAVSLGAFFVIKKRQSFSL